MKIISYNSKIMFSRDSESFIRFRMEKRGASSIIIDSRGNKEFCWIDKSLNIVSNNRGDVIDFRSLIL